MRRAMLMLLAFLMVGGMALAEPSALEGGVLIDPSAPVQIDLDGDGAAETVTYAMVQGEYEPCLQLQVTTGGGTVLTFDTDIIYGGGAWACDLDGDGQVELFAWGDVMSDDYYAYCVRLAGDHLRPLLFADASRGDNVEGYYKWGYGQLEAADPQAGTVTLCGSQDMLGTYFMCRTLKLSEDGLFEFADDGWWTRDVSALAADDEAWTYGALTLKAPVACEIDGHPDMLNPGDQIMITGTDKQTQASFITRDGRPGVLSVFEDYERGWGTQVNDISEEELFEFVPYAD